MNSLSADYNGSVNAGVIHDTEKDRQYLQAYYTRETDILTCGFYTLFKAAHTNTSITKLTVPSTVLYCTNKTDILPPLPSSPPQSPTVPLDVLHRPDTGVLRSLVRGQPPATLRLSNGHTRIHTDRDAVCRGRGNILVGQ